MSDRPYIPPGWYLDLSSDEYHGAQGVSSSCLKKLCEKTPAHLAYGPPFEATDNMVLGTAVHTLLLEPARCTDVLCMPSLNLRTKAGREEKAGFLASNAGRTILTPEQFDRAHAMAEAVEAHPIAGALLQDIIAESSIFWWYRSRDPDDPTEYKQLCKVRPDAVSRSHSLVIDLKTCADASYSGFNRAVLRYYYHLSAAMYLEGVNQCRPLLDETKQFKFTRFVLICVESESPHLVAAYELSPQYLELGRALFRRSMQIYNKAKAANFPGYPQDVRILEPPPYAQNAFIV